MAKEHNQTSSLTLVFDTTEELQTRLVLLPRVEEEGIGAVVEQCTGFDNPDEICGTIVQAIIVTNNKTKIELRNLEFSEILAALRNATPPVRLILSHENEEEDNEEDVLGEEQQGTPDANCKENAPKVEENNEPVFEEEKKADPADIVALKDQAEQPSSKSTTPNTEDNSVPSMQHSLMSWASRISATSVQLATERAQQAMEVAAERRKAAAAAVANSMSPLRTRTDSAENKEETSTLEVGLFLQTSSGAFLPLPKQKQRLSSELRVSNASLLTVRKSEAEACPHMSYSFQWYRSVERTHASDGSPAEWVELPGATSRTFQPTAIEIGHRIRCLITKSDDDESDDEGELPTSMDKALSTSLETFECVSAALPLFNGSRQALLKGAQFGGISGLGDAKGRSFRIKVDTLISRDTETRKTTSTSSLCIYQVSGTTSEPIHPEDEPITGVSAVADHESAKGFELILPDGMPESASMVAALATEGRLQLSAPNRLGRESLLLSIGIANYTGEASSLGPESVLFCDPEQKPADEVPPSNEASEPPSVDPINADPSQTESAEEPQPQLQQTENFERSVTMDDDSAHATSEADAQRMKALERELSVLRSKLSKRDKSMSEMQKQADTADLANAEMRRELAKKDDDMKEVKRELLVAQRRMQSQEDDMKRIRSDHTKAIKSFKNELDGRAATVTELEKIVRNLQNEKAVLSATVEARDGKLAKMAELKASLEETKAEAAKAEIFRDQLQQAAQKQEFLTAQLERGAEREECLRRELETAHTKIHSLEKKVKTESEKATSCRSEYDTQQMKIEKLKAERNNYKQKSDSLSKEMSRVCRQGRTIKDIEKIISDDSARRQEVELLREQKRKALEELNHYRTAFEQSRAAQRLAGLDQETTKLFERNAELERLLSELTEYVSAKEMQLDTMKEINDALQKEITDLHRSLMDKNLGKNDV